MQPEINVMIKYADVWISLVCSCVSVCIGYRVMYAFASAYSSHNTGKGDVLSASSENQRISISQLKAN
ncbi:hypothetical protein L1987_05457 [Smallanthus sonchifolius]|uniref:Uncharacterized protein n=1 Tax=Smallanthus sonchifolius TaxID=185202 RepID=A0ACB9JVE6_9ASTR|nr:hypothetical protein L1987_05457 [Smallanthus sonchifolius]